MDLRLRVLRDADAGLSSMELAARYHVSRAWVDALKQRRRETVGPAPRKQTRWRTPVWPGQEDRLRALVPELPGRTLRELREVLATSASLTTTGRAVDRLDFTLKKQRPGPRSTRARTSPPRSTTGRP
jgi:transposase